MRIPEPKKVYKEPPSSPTRHALSSGVCFFKVFVRGKYHNDPPGLYKIENTARMFQSEPCR